MHTPTTKNLWGSIEKSPLIWTGTVPKLMYGKSKELSCKVKHDRMLFNGCDRQNFSLIDEQIDEYNFLSTCDDIGWSLSLDVTGCLMVGGLHSPCMNSCIDHDNIDRVGRCLRSYDGIFEYEREKEYFYLENST